VAVDNAIRGPGCPTWSSGVCPREVVGVTARTERGFRLLAGCGSSSLVSQALWLLSVFAEWWVSLLISVCASWCRCFRVAGSSAGLAVAEELREARDAWQCSSLIGVAEWLRRTSRCTWLKGWGEDAVRDVFY
jgi:hypothetical protein